MLYAYVNFDTSTCTCVCLEFWHLLSMTSLFLFDGVSQISSLDILSVSVIHIHFSSLWSYWYNLLFSFVFGQMFCWMHCSKQCTQSLKICQKHFASVQNKLATDTWFHWLYLGVNSIIRVFSFFHITRTEFFQHPCIECYGSLLLCLVKKKWIHWSCYKVILSGRNWKITTVPDQWRYPI